MERGEDKTLSARKRYVEELEDISRIAKADQRYTPAIQGIVEAAKLQGLYASDEREGDQYITLINNLVVGPDRPLVANPDRPVDRDAIDIEPGETE